MYLSIVLEILDLAETDPEAVAEVIASEGSANNPLSGMAWDQVLPVVENMISSDSAVNGELELSRDHGIFFFFVFSCCFFFFFLLLFFSLFPSVPLFIFSPFIKATLSSLYVFGFVC